MQRDDFKCKLCGDKETTLNIHHLSYAENPWSIADHLMITLCEHCHKLIHEALEELEFDMLSISLRKDLSRKKDSYLYTVYIKSMDILVLLSMNLNGNFDYPAQVIDNKRYLLMGQLKGSK
jgi:hypothetical protein